MTLHASYAPSSWPAGTFMARLGDQTRADLLGCGRLRRFDSDTVLLAQGDTSRHVFLLSSTTPGASACAKVSASLPNGTEVLLGIRVSGDVVGELAALRGSVRNATVTTCSPIDAYMLSDVQFMKFMQGHPEAWPVLSEMIADRLDWANQRRLDFVGYSIPQRMSRLLVLLAEQHGSPVPGGHDIGVQLSQEELGKLIGASLPAVSKAVSALKRAGLITVRYRTTVVPSLDRLRDYAEPDELRN